MTRDNRVNEKRKEYTYRAYEGKKILKEAWAWYYANQQAKFLNCMTLYHGLTQENSLVSSLLPEILFEIFRHILPMTPILAKMTEISAKVFHQHSATSMLAIVFVKVFRKPYVFPWFSGKSTTVHQLDRDLEAALKAQTITERAANIKIAIGNFISKEFVTLELEKLDKSPTVALLCKYHLIAGNEVPSVALSPNKHQSNKLEGQPSQKMMRL